MNITWDKRFELGHNKIDGEHRIFLDLVIAMDSYVHSEVPKHRVLLHLEELKRYAQFHFISEENLMVDASYPKLQQHKTEHLKLLALFDSKVHDFTLDEINLSQIVDFTFQWFALHTTQVDTQLVKHIQRLDSNTHHSLSTSPV